MIKSYEIIVNGLVQGIGFRAYAAKMARSFNIRGSVKNHRNGSVNIIAAGEEQYLRTFIELIKDGPPFSSIEDVEVTEATDVPAYEDFKIEY